MCLGNPPPFLSPTKPHTEIRATVATCTVGSCFELDCINARKQTIGVATLYSYVSSCEAATSILEHSDFLAYNQSKHQDVLAHVNHCIRRLKPNTYDFDGPSSARQPVPALVHGFLTA